jgi:hypothetical protein
VKGKDRIKKMKKTIKSCFVILLCSLFLVSWGFSSDNSMSKFSIELELGPAWQSRNNVQIPNDQTGTRFSLIDLLDHGPYPSGRLYINWNIKNRHYLRLLLAPLSISESKIIDYPIRFEGEYFEPGLLTQGTYKFNSWRVSYRYRFFRGKHFVWWIGFTGKIRDAKIELQQQNLISRKTDIGFVPLLHISGIYGFSEKWKFVWDLDALAGGPGRAEDLSLKLCYSLNRNWSFSGGYRTVEGGADVEEVYAFAWLHYGTFAVELSF